MPTTGTSASSVGPSSQVIVSTARTRASSEIPLGHGLSLTTGTCETSAVPLSRGINSAMGLRVPNAAPINHGAGTCAFGAPPYARVVQQYICGDGASPFYANMFVSTSP